MATKSNVDKTLKDRGQRYGIFLGHATVTQELKEAMRRHPKFEELSPDKKEALDMIVHKIGRVLNGDPEYADSWHDIIGYARLVEQTLDAK